MVGRWQLVFWRWVVTFHDRLHEARDKAIGEAFHDKYGVWRGEEINLDSNDTFTSTVKNAKVIYTSNPPPTTSGKAD